MRVNDVMNSVSLTLLSSCKKNSFVHGLDKVAHKAQVSSSEKKKKLKNITKLISEQSLMPPKQRMRGNEIEAWYAANITRSMRVKQSSGKTFLPRCAAGGSIVAGGQKTIAVRQARSKQIHSGEGVKQARKVTVCSLLKVQHPKKTASR